jgi:uncharacterized integral membrane protein
MKNIDDTDASAPTGNPAPGFAPAVKKKLIDNKWTGIAAVAVVLILIFIFRR